MDEKPIEQNSQSHIDDHDLERYHLGMVVDEAELALLEEHLLACASCTVRAEAIADYVDAIQAAACDHDDILGDLPTVE